jgi:hypothetical protein
MRKSSAPDFFSPGKRPRRIRRKRSSDIKKPQFDKLNGSMVKVRDVARKIWEPVSKHKKPVLIGAGAVVLVVVLLVVLLSGGNPANPLLGKWVRSENDGTTTLDFHSDGTLTALLVLKDNQSMTSLSATYTVDQENGKLAVTFYGKETAYSYQIADNKLTIKNVQAASDGENIISPEETELVYTRQ